MFAAKIKTKVDNVENVNIPYYTMAYIAHGVIPGTKIGIMYALALNLEKYNKMLSIDASHSVTQQLCIVAVTFAILNSNAATPFLQQFVNEYDVPICDKENTLHQIYKLSYNANLNMMTVEATHRHKTTYRKCKDKNLVLTTSLLVYYLHQSFSNAKLRNRFITLLQRYQNLV